MQFGGPTNTDAINFIYAAGLSDRTHLQAISTLVTDLKDSRLWWKLQAIYPMVGQPGVSSSFEVNLKNPNQFRGTFYGTWSFDENGAAPDGSTGYMNTGVNDLSLGSEATFGFYTNTTTSLAGWIGGTYDGSKALGIAVDVTTTNSSNNFNSIRSATTNYTRTSTGGGLFLGTSNGILQDAYYNTVFQRSISSTTTGVNLEIYLGALNYNNTAAFFSGNRHAFSFIGNSYITSVEVSNLYAIVQKFQTTLGRQV